MDQAAVGTVREPVRTRTKAPSRARTHRFSVRLKWDHPTYTIAALFHVEAGCPIGAIYKAERLARHNPELTPHRSGRQSASVWRLKEET